MQTVRIHDSDVIAKHDKTFGGLRPIHYVSHAAARRKATQMAEHGIQAEVYQPNKLIYVKVTPAKEA